MWESLWGFCFVLHTVHGHSKVLTLHIFLGFYFFNCLSSKVETCLSELHYCVSCSSRKSVSTFWPIRLQNYNRRNFDFFFFIFMINYNVEYWTACGTWTAKSVSVPHATCYKSKKSNNNDNNKNQKCWSSNSVASPWLTRLDRSWSWIRTRRNISALCSLVHFSRSSLPPRGGTKAEEFFHRGWMVARQQGPLEAAVTRVKASSGRIHRIPNVGQRTGDMTCFWSQVTKHFPKALLSFFLPFFLKKYYSVSHFMSSYFSINMIPVCI